MAVMQNLNDPSKLGHGIAAAFIATIYGIAFANLLFLPMGNKLKAVIHSQSQVRTMVIEGLIAIAQGENPRNIESTLQGYFHHRQHPMARKKKHEEHMNHEAWAIPYGDLAPLLFALVTVMYAMSSLNEGKFRVLSDAMIAAFNGAPRSIRPLNLGQPEPGTGGEKPLVVITPTA